MKVSDNKKWYWGRSYDGALKGEALVAPGNLQIADPPYMHGEGWRIRLPGGAFHFGRLRGFFAHQIEGVEPEMIGSDEKFNPADEELFEYYEGLFGEKTDSEG